MLKICTLVCLSCPNKKRRYFNLLRDLVSSKPFSFSLHHSVSRNRALSKQCNNFELEIIIQQQATEMREKKRVNLSDFYLFVHFCIPNRNVPTNRNVSTNRNVPMHRANLVCLPEGKPAPTVTPALPEIRNVCGMLHMFLAKTRLSAAVGSLTCEHL